MSALYQLKTVASAIRMKWDTRFLDQAKFTSTWSKDPSTQVGAVIAFPDRSFTPGYNGFPACMPDTPEMYANREEKYSRIVHGEMNALLRVNRDLHGADCTLYTYPFMSCDRCFVHMLQAGIKRFVAPKATEEQNTRWGAAFNKVRKYAREAKVELLEVDYTAS